MRPQSLDGSSPTSAHNAMDLGFNGFKRCPRPPRPSQLGSKPHSSRDAVRAPTSSANVNAAAVRVALEVCETAALPSTLSALLATFIDDLAATY